MSTLPLAQAVSPVASSSVSTMEASSGGWDLLV